MNGFTKSVTRFLVSEDGPTAVEYAVMLALIVVVCLTAITAIGTHANTKFNQVATRHLVDWLCCDCQLAPLTLQTPSSRGPLRYLAAAARRL